MTPREILAIPEREPPPAGHRWAVRVVPNKYPALLPEMEGAESKDGLFVTQAARGAHEVIIETPEHATCMSEVRASHWPDILTAYAQRLSYWKQQAGFSFGMAFKNVGADAGASLEHAHSQLIVLPRVPPVVEQELASADKYHQSQGRCLFCALLKQEQSARLRLVLQTAQFVAFSPFASRFAYETWIMPKAHQGHFEDLDEAQAVELGELLRQVLIRIERVLPELAYNYVLHTTPFDMHQPAHYHWHIEITPRIAHLAGFELGTGFYINAVPPEDAATTLRGIQAA